jgi:thymidylate synthase (FAD)
MKIITQSATLEFVTPNALQYNNWSEGCRAAETFYFKALELGEDPQRARALLPNSLKTEIVMTANFREWMHFFELRTSEKAHPQMRELALQAQKLLHEVYPELF